MLLHYFVVVVVVRLSFCLVVLVQTDSYRDHSKNESDLASLVQAFKIQTRFYLDDEMHPDSGLQSELNQNIAMPSQRAKLDSKMLSTYMASLRQIKTSDELKLLIKAVRISAQGQIEVIIKSSTYFRTYMSFEKFKYPPLWKGFGVFLNF